ncbi:hypothetical protein WAI453_005314 [Rhynchosporium graminicola]
MENPLATTAVALVEMFLTKSPKSERRKSRVPETSEMGVFGSTAETTIYTITELTTITHQDRRTISLSSVITSITIKPRTPRANSILLSQTNPHQSRLLSPDTLHP